MKYRNLILMIILFLAACSTVSQHPQNDQQTPLVAAQGLRECTQKLPKLFARHIRSFGSKRSVAGALPRSFSGETVSLRKRGTVELVLGRQGRYSQVTVVGNMLTGSGIDEYGPWSMGYAGVPVRLREDEAVDFAFTAWLNRRDYLDSFDPDRDFVVCQESPAGPQISVRYELPEFGYPELNFTRADAALSSATHIDIYGHKVVRNFRNWSTADADGVRWPLVIQQIGASGRESLHTMTNHVPGVECPSYASQDCLAPPPSKLSLVWPQGSPVSVPAAFFLNEVLLRAEIGDRTFWGLVDSGASITAIDADSPLASAFTPAEGREVTAVEQRDPLTFGEIGEAVKLGGLVVEHLPAATISMPSFSLFGERRPEALIGYPIFLSSVVRIDYANQKFQLSNNVESLLSKDAIAIPLKVFGQAVVAEGKVDGITGWFVLDTGDSAPLDLFKDWAAAHGFPGHRLSYTVQQRSEIGSKQVGEKRMRPATFQMGPIHVSEPLVAINSVNSVSDRIAGQVGYGVFARCAAAVFDIQGRTLWLEPPCDRDLPEDLSGWALERKDSISHPDRPWVVRYVISGGSAERAGVKAGDRIMQIADKPAILDVATFEFLTKQAPDTELSVIVVREEARKELQLHLIKLPLSLE